MLDRIINILFLFALIFVFLLEAKAEDHLRIIIAVVLSFILVTIAFFMNWLSLDGARSAFTFGLISYGLGGIPGAALILTFFISSSLLSKDLISEDTLTETKFRRDGMQVWSNGFWFSLWIVIGFLFESPVFMIAAASSIAFATSDTWASEIGGHRVKGKTYLISSFSSVKPGTDGGVSVAGTLASFDGPLLIAVVFWLTNLEMNFFTVLMIAIAGLTGSFVDSWLGAKIQGKTLGSFSR